MMQYTIRKADLQDLPRIEQIYEFARGFMARNGNPTQWGSTEPPHDLLVQDIHQQRLYILLEDDMIHGVFYYFLGNDPNYEIIYDGSWRSCAPYGTIHRIASDGSGGILKAAVAFCVGQCRHLRMDTHEDNRVMQSALGKLGFHRCGTIICDDGTPRIAYDLI